MANRYDITVRSFYNSEGISEMNAQRWDSLSAQKANVLVQQMLTNCIAEYRICRCVGLDVTEESIVDSFNELTQTLADLEQNHNEQSVTFKIFHTFVTVQVIFGEELT